MTLLIAMACRLAESLRTASQGISYCCERGAFLGAPDACGNCHNGSPRSLCEYGRLFEFVAMWKAQWRSERRKGPRSRCLRCENKLRLAVHRTIMKGAGARLHSILQLFWSVNDVKFYHGEYLPSCSASETL